MKNISGIPGRSAKWARQLGQALLLLLLGSICGQAALAQTPWQTDQVLSRHLIYQLVQDTQGFLWAATDNGMYRYDGYQAVALNHLLPAQSGKLPIAHYTVAWGKAGKLWLLGEHGLFCYATRQQTLTHVAFPRPASDYAPEVPKLVADTLRDRLWVQAGARTLVALTLSKGTVVPGSRYTFASPIGWFNSTASGSLWVATVDRMLTQLLAGQPVQRYQAPEGVCLLPVPDTHPAQFISSCAQYGAQSNGQLREVQRWLPSSFGNFGEKFVFAPHLTAGAEQWLAGRYLVRLQRPAAGLTYKALVEPQQLPDSITYSGSLYYEIFTDALGLEWCFSPSLRGCYRRYRSLFIQPLQNATRTAYSTRAITRLPDQRLLIGSYSSTWLQAANQPTARLLPYPGNNYVFSNFLPVTGNQVLAADENGFGLLNTNTWRVHWIGSSAKAGEQVLPATSLARGQGGRIWAGTLAGLFWLDATQLWLHPYTGLPTGALTGIRAMDLDAAGYLWLATTNGLYRLQPATGQLLRFAVGGHPGTSLPTNELLCVRAAGAHAWVGTRDQGLLRIDPKRGVVEHLTTANGLPSNTVCSLLTDAQANLWLGTYGGVVRYQPLTHGLSIFTTVDGLADNECNAYSAFRDADGTLYFGGVKGVTRFVPQQLNSHFSLQRRLVVRRVVYSAKNDTLTQVSYPRPGIPSVLRLAEGDQALVQVALTDYFNPARALYKYQFQGAADTVWHQLVGSSSIHLRKLPPGAYTLVVKAAAANGCPAANVLRLPFVVSRDWWKSPVVPGAAILVVLVSLVAYVQWSRARQRRQQQQLRGRLAHDLHDELGSLLVRASLQAEVLKRSDSANAATATNLLSDLQTASHAMRDVVWGIDPQVNTLGSLVDRMREHLALTVPLAGREADLRLSGVEEDKLVSSALRQHVYAIFKEAITNSLRHAHTSTSLTVSLEQQPRNLILCVLDNGSPTDNMRREGVGMRSMTQRAQLLGGQVEASYQPEGFLVKLVIPV